MPGIRTLVIGALVGGAFLVSGPAAGSAAPWTQHIAITIGARDRVGESNFALVRNVPVQVTITNFTQEFHTFTLAGFDLSVLVRRGSRGAPRTTTFTFTPHRYGEFAWHCAICPSGMHGTPHVMGGMLYVIIDPFAVR